MKMKNLTRAVILLLLMAVLFASFCGCVHKREKTPESTTGKDDISFVKSENFPKNDNEMNELWNSFLNSSHTTVARALMVNKISQSISSSSLDRYLQQLDNDESILKLMNIICNHDLYFEKQDKGEEFYYSEDGMLKYWQGISLTFYDDFDAVLTGFTIDKEGCVFINIPESSDCVYVATNKDLYQKISEYYNELINKP